MGQLFNKGMVLMEGIFCCMSLTLEMSPLILDTKLKSHEYEEFKVYRSAVLN